VLAALAAAVLAASDAPATGYEDELVQWALKLHGRELEPSPEGKRVEEVLFAIEDVFSKSDPWPELLNNFHWKTKEDIVRREVLLSAGDTWDADKVAETERNLRSLVILAVAKVVAVKGKEGGVALLVVTKDRWSLRTEWSYLVVGTVLEYLYVPITEINFLGRNMELAVLPYLRRDTFQIGELFVAPRVLGTRVQLAENANIGFNRATGALEATQGYAEVSQPLLTLDQKWGFDVVGQWNVRRQRIYRGADIWQLGYPNDTAATTFVPYIYDARVFDVFALITRSYGTRWKLNLTGGPGAYIHQYQPPPEETLAPQVRSWFIANWLPRSEDSTFVYGLAHFYLADFRTMHDVDTFALTEDKRIGPSLRGGFKWSIPTFAAVSPFLELAASATWTFLLRDDLLSLQVAAGARFVQAGGTVYNQHYAFQVVNVSPPFEGGRFVARVLGDFRVNDLDNTQVLLGGGTGLRGVPPEALTGHNELLGNFEYRTRPFALFTVHIGFVVFYDVGSAFDTRPVLTHTIGMGVRILLPQLNTEVIRLDVGFVLGSGVPFNANNVSSTFGQVTAIPTPPTFFDDPI
jgi:hypothetical protein